MQESREKGYPFFVNPLKMILNISDGNARTPSETNLFHLKSRLILLNATILVLYEHKNT